MAPLPAPAEKPSHRVSDSQSHAKVRPPAQVAVFCAALWPNLQPALTQHPVLAELLPTSDQWHLYSLSSGYPYNTEKLKSALTDHSERVREVRPRRPKCLVSGQLPLLPPDAAESRRAPGSIFRPLQTFRQTVIRAITGSATVCPELDCTAGRKPRRGRWIVR